MLSNTTLNSVVDALSYLQEARKASCTDLKAGWLQLAQCSIGYALEGIPLDHPLRGAIETKERSVILARASLIS